MSAFQPKVRPRQVSAWQSLRPVVVDEAATCGAQLGVNLLMPDGSLATTAKLAAWFGTGSSGTDASGIGTTDDLQEGQWNLWFTSRRAQDAVGAILANSANVTLTYMGGTSITADLTSLTDSGAGALLATSFDVKGRKIGSRAATITGTAGRVTVANGDASAGLPTIDLATVADGGGGALLRFVRDAWGRITGTSAATTSDLAEGSNLYYTDARADARITAQKGVANGLAPLGGDGKVSVTYLPSAVLGQVSYQGTWDASTGTPPTTTPSKGWYYIVTVAGSTNLGGITDWKVGDWAIYDVAWDKVDNTDAISSWNGRTGAVVPQSGDYTAAQVGAEPAITAGTTSQYWRGDKSWQDFATGVRAAVLTGLSLATSAVISATDTVLGALGKLQAQITDNLLPAGYIDGLKMVWVSGTALTVTTGSAYIQGSSKVLRATADIAKAGLSLTASTWYHAYLWNNAGTPDIEISTTAPASPYNGTARSKTGDNSRRYVGSIKTDSSGNLINFDHSNADGSVFYKHNINNDGLFVLNTGSATTATNVDCSAAIPVSGSRGYFFFDNSDYSGNIAFVSSADFSPLTTAFYVRPASGTGKSTQIRSYFNLYQQKIAYQYNGTTTSGLGLSIYVCGYIYER